MSLHKLTAGSGYDYLTRQVAALDATDKGHVGLASYYTEKGETPGVWIGSGMAGIDGLDADDVVTAEQMQNLFGAGQHPLATDRTRALDHQIGRPDTVPPTEADYLTAARLGAPFKVYDHDVSVFRIEVARRLAALNGAAGVPGDWPVPAAERARVRTEVARELFRTEHGRDPSPGADGARELAAVIAQHSRPKTTAVAGYDLTFSPVKSVSTLWAIADPHTAATIERAHQAAVQDALTFLEATALYTREGTNGVRQVDVRGLVATAFTHRDSRAGDPDLHTHHAVSVALLQFGRTRYDLAAATPRPLVSPSERIPYAVAPTTEWVRRIGAAEAAAAGYVNRRQFPPLLNREHRADPTSASRLNLALARWDVEAHRGLAGHRWPENIVLVIRTQAFIAGSALTLLDAAAAQEPDYVPGRLVEAIGRSGAAWSDLGGRWDDLTPTGTRPADALLLAAGELRAAARELTQDGTTRASSHTIRTRPGAAEGLHALLASMRHCNELAHVVDEKSATPGLSGHARVMSHRAENDIAAGRVPIAVDNNTAWVSPLDIHAGRTVPAPVPVIAALKASSHTAVQAATAAGAIATATSDVVLTALPYDPAEADLSRQRQPHSTGVARTTPVRPPASATSRTAGTSPTR